MNEELNTNEPNNKKWNDGNSKTLKLIAICLSAFLGGFIAIFTLSALLSAAYKPILYHITPPSIPKEYMKELDDILENDFDFLKPPRTKLPTQPIVNVEENAQNYKLYINLKKFDNNENNLKIEAKPYLIKITGKADIKKENEQSSFSYFKEFSLNRKIDTDKIQKERIGNNYVITLPIDD